MKIVAFGASTSKNSINKALATHAAHLFKNAQVEILDLNDLATPLFNVDLEAETGHPENARRFLHKIGSADLLVISLAEHNASYSAAFKNLLDWASRIDGKVFQNKPIFLLATSPGARGGQSVLEAAKHRFPYMGGVIEATFSLPEFFKNFSTEKNELSPEFRPQVEKIVRDLEAKFSK